MPSEGRRSILKYIKPIFYLAKIKFLVNFGIDKNYGFH